MKKLKLLIQTLTCAGLLFTGTSAFCQVQTLAEYYKNKAYDGYELVDTTKATPEQMARIHTQQHGKQLSKDHYYIQEPVIGNIGVRFVDTGKEKSEVYQGNGWFNAKPLNTVLIDGHCAVEFAALDINEKNAADYRYHVVLNDDKELVPWTKPTVFKYTTTGKIKYAFLGRFNYAPQQVLRVEIFNLQRIKKQDEILVDWRKVEPARFNSFAQYVSRSWRIPDNGLLAKDLDNPRQTAEQYYKQVNKKMVLLSRPVRVPDFIETTSLKDIRFRADDSVQNISFNIINGDRGYRYKVSLKREVDGHTDSINLIETNTSYDLNKEFWKKPGKYTVIFTPKLQKHGGEPIKILRNQASSISFTVLPALDVSHSIPLRAVILMAFVLIIIIALLFLYYRKRQKRILEAEAQTRQIATLQLQSVRSQLNPHFMFNALAGIQNLMNKNEIELANKYLARFARITRNVLDDGQKELTSIEHETDLLNDYLQMEQMRFGFEFSIDVDKEIDQQIEIPAMLLQPFVENAVKHGVSTLKNKGLISVSITKKATDLLLRVSDNGKGFTGNAGEGKGIKLCEDRIKLMNSIYKNTTILLHKNSNSNGAFITIELKNWL